jgi:hypothetical protein
MSFWARAEPMLVAFAAIGICALRLQPATAALTVGVVAGLSMGLKLHACLYLAPAAMWLVARQNKVTDGMRMAAVVIAAAAILTVLPFLHPAVNLGGYLDYLSVATQQGLSPQLLETNALFAALMLAPTAIIYAVARPNLDRATAAYAVTWVLSVAVAAVIAAKYGAGPHHLLPFLPSAVLLAAQAARGGPQPIDPAAAWQQRQGARGLFLVCLAAFGTSWVVHLANFTVEEMLGWARARDIAQDAAKIYGAYPTAEMGITDGANFHLYYYRVVGVLAGAPVAIDVTSWMDFTASGAPPRFVEELVEHCRVVEWILPARGTPFAYRGYYQTNGSPASRATGSMFSERFRELFAKNYRRTLQGHFFDVWSCRDNAFSFRPEDGSSAYSSSYDSR